MLSGCRRGHWRICPVDTKWQKKKPDRSQWMQVSAGFEQSDTRLYCEEERSDGKGRAELSFLSLLVPEESPQHHEL